MNAEQKRRQRGAIHVAHCEGKQRFPNRGAANKAMPKFKRPGRFKGAEVVETYKCVFCGGWHLGSKLK